MIRLLNPDDAAAWRALRLEGLRTDPDAFGQTYEESTRQDVAAIAARFTPEALVDVPVFGAFSADGSLVGTCGLVRASRPKERHKATLWGMYVQAPARGTGLGERLLLAALAHARTMPGILQVHLSVVSSNEGAARLYRKHGFVAYGLERRALRWQGIDLDEAHMACFLDT